MGIIVSWKNMSKVSGFSIRTLQRWHAADPIPLTKTTWNKQGHVMVEEQMFRLWLLYRRYPEKFLHKLQKMSHDVASLSYDAV